MSDSDGKANYELRAQILREELESRLEFLEEADDEIFGAFTIFDWLFCTLFFFALPLVVLGLMIL